MDTLRTPDAEHAALADDLAAAGVEFAMGAWVDVTGRAKSKLVPIDGLPGMLAGSERYTPRGIGDPHEPPPQVQIEPAVHLFGRTRQRSQERGSWRRPDRRRDRADTDMVERRSRDATSHV